VERVPTVISRDANTGAGHDFTGLAAAVQLRLRVALGLQTLTVKSRLLTGENTVRIRGNPPISEGDDGVMDCWIIEFPAWTAACPINPPLQQSIIPIHYADVAQPRTLSGQFRKLPGIAPRECESLHRLQ
jgi:hypothetical protein